MFVVPKFLVDEDGSLGERNGVVATNIEKKMGIKGSTTCELTFGIDRPAVGYLVGGVFTTASARCSGSSRTPA
jgi:alkylation response protein AidB-like acyl-CoA dehydrogenase